jgi:hypothetical protein
LIPQVDSENVHRQKSTQEDEEEEKDEETE